MFVPFPNVFVLLAEVLHFFAITVQVNVVACEVHRVNNGIFDDTRLQALVEEDILDGQRHLTVFCTFHQREPAQFFCNLLGVTIDNVAKLLVAANDIALIHTCTNLFADTPPLIAHGIIILDKEALIVCTIHNAEGSATMRLEGHHEKLTRFTAYFINDV